jgi:cytoskeletal protein CcmA (bactofilin family)
MFVLRAGGRLHGDIETACLEIEPHAFYQGSTRMTRPQAASVSRDAAAPEVVATAPAPI